MDRESWMLHRAYLPAVALFGLALLVMVPLGVLRDSPQAAAMFNALRWAPVAMAGAALLMFGYACGKAVNHRHDE